MENTRIGHYITEKLINGFRAGIIPIYWGSQHISEHFNSKRFIILEDTSESSINKVINKMANMSDKLHRYHMRFEKLAEQICEKLGVDYNSSNIEIATFNDALSNYRSYFNIK